MYLLTAYHSWFTSSEAFIAYGQFGVGTIAAVIVAIAMLFMLFRPDPNKNKRLVAKRSVMNA